ncbi:hypothetical protein ONZ45_g12855 [Pleurotus djamor]|nr:hypothetical protein ONZ45_g12855 [Pleurotus djamor]
MTDTLATSDINKSEKVAPLPSLQRRGCIELPPSETPLESEFHLDDSSCDPMDVDGLDSPEMKPSCLGDPSSVFTENQNHPSASVGLHNGTEINIEEIQFSPMTSPNLMSLPNNFQMSSFPPSRMPSLDIDLPKISGPDLASQSKLLSTVTTMEKTPGLVAEMDQD